MPNPVRLENLLLDRSDLVLFGFACRSDLFPCELGTPGRECVKIIDFGFAAHAGHCNVKQEL